MKLKRFSVILLIIGFIGLSAGIVVPILTHNPVNEAWGIWYHWPRCVSLLSVEFILTGLVCLIFRNTVEKSCSVKTFLLALSISAAGGLGVFCIFNWLGMVWFGESDAYPVQYPLTVAIGCATFVIFVVLIVFYIKQRRKQWSFKGLLIDLATSILYLPAFFYVFLVLYYVIDNIFH